jgi:hypothetical protein
MGRPANGGTKWHDQEDLEAKRRGLEADRREAALNATFPQIPPDLRRDALMWMLKDEILWRWRRGDLEERVAHLFRVNGVERPKHSDAAYEVGRRETTGTTSADATEDYWWAYREQGRFGSHPSHDDFGDEGRP